MMNRRLIQTYKSLTRSTQASLVGQYKDSPKMLALLQLTANAEENITTQQAVAVLYADEPETPFETLRNRYFKLRKKLLEDMEQHETDNTISQTELHMELEQCKQMIYTGELSIGRSRSQKLIKKLEAQNIFELLPEAYRILIYSNQALRDLGALDMLSKEFLKAVQVQSDYWNLQVLQYQTYQQYSEKGFEEVKRTLTEIKSIADKWPQYPRFRLAYLLANITNGTGSEGNTIRALSRYFNQYEELRKQHPFIPAGVYENNFFHIDRFKWLLARAAFEFKRQDLAATYTCTTEYWELMQTVPELQHKFSEPLYLNKLRVEIALGKYKAALNTLDELKSFNKRNDNLSHFPTAVIEEARIYVYGFNALKASIPADFTRQLEQGIRRLENPHLLTLGDAYGLLALLQFYQGDYDAARITINKKACQEYFKHAKVAEIYDLFELPFASNQKEAAQKLKSHISLLLGKDIPGHVAHFVQLLNSMLDQYRKRM